MPRISYLDFSAEDPERAVNFYNKIFGWQINKWDGPQYIAKIESGGGRIIQPKSAIPGIGYTLLFKDTESNTIGLFVENKNAK